MHEQPILTIISNIIYFEIKLITYFFISSIAINETELITHLVPLTERLLNLVLINNVSYRGYQTHAPLSFPWHFLQKSVTQLSRYRSAADISCVYLSGTLYG